MESNKAGKRQYNYKVESSDVDFLRRATVKSICDRILATAGEDADKHGFGTARLGEQNLTWVLSRMACEIYRLPAEREPYSVATWVSDVRRMTTIRNFDLLDSEGTIIGGAVSQWAVLDLTSRQAVDLERILSYGNMLQDFSSPIEMPARLRSPQVAAERNYKVVYSDIDFNRHMHSTNYLRLALDMLPIEILERSGRMRLDINFLHETRYGDLLTVTSDMYEPCLFEITDNGEVACRIRFNAQQ